MFKHELHHEVCKAVIKSIKKRKPDKYDDKKTYQIIKDYFHDMNNQIPMALCFCPDDSTLIEQIKGDIEGMKSKGQI